MPVDLPELNIIEDVVRALSREKQGTVEVIGPWGSGRTLVAVQAGRRLGTPVLVLTAGRFEAEAVHDDLTTFVPEDESVLFPAWEVLPDELMAPSDDVVAERFDALRRLSTALEAGRPLCVTLPVRALLQRVLRRKYLDARTLTLERKREYAMDDLLERLIKMGYEREPMVEQRGQMSVRGGILDVFPISA